MKVYDDYKNNIIDKYVFIEILEFIQSYTYRRFIVGLPTNALNKIFMNLYDKVDKFNYLESIQRSLLSRGGIQRFPKDIEVIEALKIKDVYNIKSKNRIYLLERLENHNNREEVSIENNQNITIEHIFPQNPDKKWEKELSKNEYTNIRENYLNTLSNLTLSGNNGKLGNKTFLDKRDLKEYGYRDSRLWLNKYLSEIDKWDIEHLDKRFKILSERFLEIWKYPKTILNIKEADGEVNIFDADDPTNKKLEYAIFLDQNLEIKTVTDLYIEVFKRLFELEAEVFFTTDLSEEISLTKNIRDNKLRTPTKINENYYIERNGDNKWKFKRIKYALNLFGLEDELIIKYAD